MTCNISAVAVCCSKASRVSVKSRAFSIAMTACAAKFCSNAICLSVNGRTSLAVNDDRPEQHPLFAQRDSGHRADATEVDQFLVARVDVVRFRPAGRRRPATTCSPCITRPSGLASRPLSGRTGPSCRRHSTKSSVASDCGEVKLLAIKCGEMPVIGLAQPHCPFEHCIEHRREIAGRGVDDLQHLGGRGLLLQCLARLSDQPRILHRDHRLRSRSSAIAQSLCP